MDNIKYIEAYGDNALELIKDFDDAGVLADLDEEIVFTIERMFDFEAINFFVINGPDNPVVITADSINGEVICSEDLDSFVTNIIEEAKENM